MFCTKCGKENPDQSGFCSSCGEKLTTNTAGESKEQRNPVKQQAAVQREKKSHAGVITVVAVLAAALLGTGGFFLWNRMQKDRQAEEENTETEEEEIVEVPEEPVVVEPTETAGPAYQVALSGLTRPSFYDAEAMLNYNAALVPSVPEYSVAADLSNIINGDRYYFSDEQRAMLAENGFYVTKTEYGANEFFVEYEDNRYMQLPNFVTVDSLMHTYHIYFSYLLRNTEREYLSAALSDLSEAMLAESLAQYEALQGSEWEEAAKQNVIFFAVGARLQNDSIEIPDFARDVTENELQLIGNAEGIAVSPMMNRDEDYSQYKPRGYYDGDEQLERYFRAMMWYGRIGFQQGDELTDRSALLMTLALSGGALEQWEAIYSVTSFFAGASDDLGYYEYLPIVAEVYGENISMENLIGNDTAWQQFHALTGELRPPVINSLSDGDDDIEMLNYRFMGQRFSIDAAIMQKLIYDNVGDDSNGYARMLPDVLDVPAALGSDAALDILEMQGDTEHANYMENLEELRLQYNNASPELWTASLYACWLDTLRPLLIEKGEGYPFFMQSEAWWQKDLETFAGSYTELKHDTVLYSKQVLAEMGGGDGEILDDRGYVQPEPLVYAKFCLLAGQTADGLASYGMLSDADAENLQRLEDLASQLVTISEKELVNETLTDEEYELIRSYGGTLEHFWLDAMRDQTDSEYIMAAEFPCPLAVDIASNLDGSVLEAATGQASTVYVAVPVDGTIRICSGSVYSFYQFEWPLNDRLTDSEWRQMMGWEMNDNNEYERTAEIEQPDWTQGYRAGYEE